MLPAKSLSLTPSVKNWLANTRQPRILHVFDRACNLINERGEVLSVVTPGIGNGPFNLVVEDMVLFTEHLNIESPVSIIEDRLILGDLTLSTTEAKLWPPCPDWEMLHSKRKEILNQLSSLPSTNYESLLPNSLLTTFSTALAHEDIKSSVTAAQELAGLGMGLTPSGDDFIMGGIHAAWIIHPYEAAKKLTQEIVNTAAPLTTSLSAAWIRSEGRGEAGELWHRFFEAICTGDESDIQRDVDRILSVGETSGVDAFAGFVGTITPWVDRQSPVSHL
jgi:hypothetical protein